MEINVVLNLTELNFGSWVSTSPYSVWVGGSKDTYRPLKIIRFSRILVSSHDIVLGHFLSLSNHLEPLV